MSTSSPNAHAWWREVVFGRLAAETGAPFLETLTLLGATEEGLGLDAVILEPNLLEDDAEAIAAAHRRDLRLVVEIPAPEFWDRDELMRTARAWLNRGADGISIRPTSPGTVQKQLEPPASSKVTRIFPGPAPVRPPPPGLYDSARNVVAGYRDRVLLAWWPAHLRGPLPSEPDLVIETSLSRQPWRARALGRTLEERDRTLPAGTWPGYALGAPRRSGFLRGSAGRSTRACAAALLLTLRGTPCFELGQTSRVPQDAALRAWIRQLTLQRRNEPTLRRGTFRPLAQDGAILGYVRQYEAERLAVLLNLGRRTHKARLPTGFPWTVVLSSDPALTGRLGGSEVRIPPDGALIVRAGNPLSRSLGGTGRRRAAGN